MTDYVCNFYRSSSFDETVLIKVLSALSELEQGFFPLVFWRSSREKLIIEQPSDFSRQMVPVEYFIEPGIARIPFEAANGADVVFTESDNAMLSPPNLDIEFSEARTRLESWSVPSFFALFKAIATAFEPEHGHLADIEELTRPAHEAVRFDIDTNKVPTSLHWVNYFGTRWVQRIGADRLRLLSETVPAFEWLKNGAVLLALQQAPFRERNPLDVETQRVAEVALDLKKLHREYPNTRI